jgi:hypothetical protein
MLDFLRSGKKDKASNTNRDVVQIIISIASDGRIIATPSMIGNNSFNNLGPSLYMATLYGLETIISTVDMINVNGVQQSKSMQWLEASRVNKDKGAQYPVAEAYKDIILNKKEQDAQYR